MDPTEGQLLRANNEGDIITANGEIVGELVMEGGDPSVIVESIVNADGSVFVDEREFNTYCNNHLNHQVDHSPDSQVLDIEAVDINKMTKHTDSPTSTEHMDSLRSPMDVKSSGVTDHQDGRIWIMKESSLIETEVENYPDENEENDDDDDAVAAAANAIPRTARSVTDASDVVFTDEAGQQLLLAQLGVLKAEKGKLYHETEMLKLKKDKLKLQINCYTNEIRKQEMEKEKLRLEIKLLQSKLVDDANDVSLIFVP